MALSRSSAGQIMSSIESSGEIFCGVEELSSTTELHSRFCSVKLKVCVVGVRVLALRTFGVQCSWAKKSFTMGNSSF